MTAGILNVLTGAGLAIVAMFVILAIAFIVVTSK